MVKYLYQAEIQGLFKLNSHPTQSHCFVLWSCWIDKKKFCVKYKWKGRELHWKQSLYVFYIFICEMDSERLVGKIIENLSLNFAPFYILIWKMSTVFRYLICKLDSGCLYFVVLATEPCPL